MRYRHFNIVIFLSRLMFFICYVHQRFNTITLNLPSLPSVSLEYFFLFHIHYIE